MKLITSLLFTSKAANTIYMVNADEREYKLKIILFSQARGSECFKRQTAAASNVNCNYITTVCRKFLFGARDSGREIGHTYHQVGLIHNA